MKSKILIIAICLAGFFTFQSCDYVQNASEVFTVKTPGDRKILIEDYTGRKCGNCPAAADELHHLDSIYKGHIIPLAVHAGFFAVPNAQYPGDLRNATGTAWDNTFGNSIAGNPNGFVNRTGYTGSGFIKQHSSWGSYAAAVYSDSAYFSLAISNTYNSSTNQVTCKVTCKGKKLRTGIFNLSVVILEDSLTGTQLDYRIDAVQHPSQVDSNYVFDHVLRGSLNTPWGEQVFSGTVLKNDSVVKTYSNYQLSSSWKYKKCHIIAFIYDADPTSPTYYEILQAEIKELY